jgi:predicted dienelactone hydrolase
LRCLICGLLLAVAWTSNVLADAESFRVGIMRITVQDTTPFDALIAYPTEAVEVFLEEGPFRLSASRDTPVAVGARFPVVLFSHGSGRGQGRPSSIANFSFTWRGMASSLSRRFIPA